jgi:hypothetical protein
MTYVRFAVCALESIRYGAGLEEVLTGVGWSVVSRCSPLETSRPGLHRSFDLLEEIPRVPHIVRSPELLEDLKRV